MGAGPGPASRDSASRAPRRRHVDINTATPLSRSTGVTALGVQTPDVIQTIHSRFFPKSAGMEKYRCSSQKLGTLHIIPGAMASHSGWSRYPLP